MERIMVSTPPAFPIGKLEITCGIEAEVCDNPAFAKFVGESFDRFIHKDWGDLCKEDIAENALSLEKGFRLMGSYQGEAGKIWIITEADRSSTCILFPFEY